MTHYENLQAAIQAATSRPPEQPVLPDACWPDLALSVATENMNFAVKHRTILGVMREGQLKRVQQVLFASDPRRFQPGLENELAFIRKGRGNDLPVHVVCDLYAEDRVQTRRYAFMILPPRPTWLLCKAAKERLLKLRAMCPAQVEEAYFVVVYSSEGNRKEHDWTPLQRWFESRDAPEVLIGAEFWDKIGGTGTYEALLEAIEESRTRSRERIQ